MPRVVQYKLGLKLRFCNACQEHHDDSDFYRDNKTCRKHRNKRIKNQRQSVCECCGVTWQPPSGTARRNFKACDDCFPLVERAIKLHHSARHRANKKSIPFELDLSVIIEGLKHPCPHTGQPFDHEGKKAPYMPSVDRIVPELGYTNDNTQVVAWIYNLSKNSFTHEEVVDFCQKISFKATESAIAAEAQTH